MIGLKIENVNIVMTYREWNFDGNPKTSDIKLQLDRWNQFLMKASKMKGNNSFIIGDINFDYWNSSSNHQTQLEPLKEATRDYLATNGWVQLVKSCFIR